MRSDVVAFMACRNEACFLPLVFQSLKAQTLAPSQMIFVDDCSEDNSGEIAEEHDATVIRLCRQHPSFTGRPELAKIWNVALRHLDSCCDYMLQCGGDVVLPKEYIEKLVGYMQRDELLVIASGVIQGEATYPTHVRGAGRIYKTWFWHRYIKQYPVMYGWESYPLYKALSLGFKVKSFPELTMTALRRTSLYKPLYGYAMRELGYFPPYAVIRCLMNMCRDWRTGLQTLYTYVTSPYKPHDPTVTQYIKRHQLQNMKTVLSQPHLMLERLT